MEDMMNNEENFLLKWNNHQSNLIGVFKEWLSDESFVDVTLVCGGEAVVGHKVVLAACSPLLNRILHDNPCRHPVVILNDVCSTDMKALLKFIYQGEVSVSQSELASFLRTADNLQIKGLAEDKEKEDKKRREKSDSHGGVRKKRRTDYKVSSSQCTPIHNKANPDSLSSSLKSQKHCSSKDKFSSFNSHQTPGGVVHSNSVNNQTIVRADNIAQSLEAELEQVADQHFIKKDLVVKTEPLDYPGEMVWQEGNSLTNKENANQDHCENTSSNASSSSNVLNQQSSTGTIQFSVLPSSLDNFGSGSTADFLQRNLETLQSEEKRLEEDGKGNEEVNQSNIVATYEEGTEDETLNMGSPGKFRGGRKPCCFCGKTFCDNYTLRRHMVTHLSRQRQFECSLCSAAYSRKDHLMAHMRRKHPGAEYEIETVTKPS